MKHVYLKLEFSNLHNFDLSMPFKTGYQNVTLEEHANILGETVCGLIQH